MAINTVVGVGRFQPREILIPQVSTVPTTSNTTTGNKSSESCENGDLSESMELLSDRSGSSMTSMRGLILPTVVPPKRSGLVPFTIVMAQLRINSYAKTNTVDTFLTRREKPNMTVTMTGIENIQNSTSIIDAIFARPPTLRLLFKTTTQSSSLSTLAPIPEVVSFGHNSSDGTGLDLFNSIELLKASNNSASKSSAFPISSTTSRAITPLTNSSYESIDPLMNGCATGQLTIQQIICLICMLTQVYVSIFGSRMRSSTIRWMVLQYSLLHAVYLMSAAFSPLSAPIWQCVSAFLIAQTIAGPPIFSAIAAASRRRPFVGRTPTVWTLNLLYYVFVIFSLTTHDRLDIAPFILAAYSTAWLSLALYFAFTVISGLYSGWNLTACDAIRRLVYYAPLLLLYHLAAWNYYIPAVILPLTHFVLTVLLVRMYREQYINAFACRDVYRGGDVQPAPGPVV